MRWHELNSYGGRMWGLPWSLACNRKAPGLLPVSVNCIELKDLGLGMGIITVSSDDRFSTDPTQPANYTNLRSYSLQQ